MDNRNIMEALLKDALYTYEFDVTTGIVVEDIIDRTGCNITKALGLSSPCLFDEMIRRAFGDFLKCRYAADSYLKDLSSHTLLHAYVCGKRRLEANLYQTVQDQYVRLTYLLSRNPADDHVLAFVICEDITELEKGRDSSFELDNRSLKLERDTLTRQKHDLTEERDALTRQRNDLTEERDALTRQRNDLTEERDALTQQRDDLTEERDALTRQRNDLTEERDALTRQRNDLTEERDALTQQRDDLTEERDALTRQRNDLTEERDALTRQRNDLTEERDALTQQRNDLTEERDALTQQRNDLTEERDVLTAENIELTHAADAVHAMLKAGSYVCAYSATGDQMVGIKYSEALRKLYGYADETDFPDVWESWMNCIVPEDRAYVENSYQAAVKDHSGNTTYDVTYRSRRKDGAVRWQRAAGYVMRRDNGSPITCYGLVMDVDEQKKAADKIEQALTEAQIANAAKTSFLARMSHDIRTPMNGILGLIEINEKHADDQMFTSRNRQKAKVAATYLLSLINDVLQLSKLEDPSVTLSYEAFNVEKLAEDILTIIKLRAVEYGVTLEHADCASRFSYPYVWGSPLHVRQIFINILSNCIKYNKKGGSIFCRADSKKIGNDRVLYRVTIADTGIGMSAEFLEHLFEPFSREHTGVNSSYEGVGLGMSIVKQLVEKMDGTIEVHSQEGEGSTFILEIPFDIARKEDIRDEEMEAERSCISGARVLLVEDNELNMEIAETFLMDAGAQVTKAVNGQQAVYLFRENPPGTFDIILMDVMMPVMNGYEATRTIRALDRPDASTIPIVAMTANAFVEDIQESREAGMNEHISKPLDITKVIAVIGKYREEMEAEKNRNA